MVIDSLRNNQVVNMLKHGSVGIIPTDTVYGIVCLASNSSAVQRLYDLKDGRANKPGTLVAADINQLENLGIKARYLKAVEYLWPNPLSIIIPLGDSLSYLHQGLGSIPVRIPLDKKLISLLKKTGPLLTTSANTSGKPPANDIAQAQDFFGKKIDFYVNGGRLNNPPSTIIRIVDDAIEIIRPGALKIDESGRIFSK